MGLRNRLRRASRRAKERERLIQRELDRDAVAANRNLSLRIDRLVSIMWASFIIIILLGGLLVYFVSVASASQGRAVDNVMENRLGIDDWENIKESAEVHYYEPAVPWVILGVLAFFGVLTLIELICIGRTQGRLNKELLKRARRRS